MRFERTGGPCALSSARAETIGFGGAMPVPGLTRLRSLARSCLAPAADGGQRELVALVSDDPAIAEQEARRDDVRERVRTSGGEALVYSADKIAKVRELRLLVARGTDEPEIASRKRPYEKSLSMIEAQAQTCRLASSSASS